MRNPGESSEGRVQSETSSEGTIGPMILPLIISYLTQKPLVLFILFKAYAKGSERDECDSPPCKRLKQGQ